MHSIDHYPQGSGGKEHAACKKITVKTRPNVQRPAYVGLLAMAAKSRQPMLIAAEPRVISNQRILKSHRVNTWKGE